jgi:hypothetical protein
MIIQIRRFERQYRNLQRRIAYIWESVPLHSNYCAPYSGRLFRGVITLTHYLHPNLEYFRTLLRDGTFL